MESMTMLTREVPFTRADLDAMPDDGNRYELLDGTIIMTPAPRIVHQSISGALHLALARQCPKQFKLLYAPVDVVLADDTVLQPDLLIAPLLAFTERDLPAAPALAIEVLSPSTRSVDLVLKRERYQRAEVPSYWIVDCDQKTLHVLTLTDGLYTTRAELSVGETLTTDEPFPLTLELAEIFD